MRNVWVLIVYNEDPQHSFLKKELTESLERVRDFYDEDNYDVVVNALPLEGNSVEDMSFDIVRKDNQERIADIEFWPEGYNPIPLEDALDLARNLGCEIEEE